MTIVWQLHNSRAKHWSYNFHIGKSLLSKRINDYGRSLSNREYQFFIITIPTLLLENVSFSIQKGEIFSVIGSNGSGKSTLLHRLPDCSLLKTGRSSLKMILCSEESLKSEEFKPIFQRKCGLYISKFGQPAFLPYCIWWTCFAPRFRQERIKRLHFHGQRKSCKCWTLIVCVNRPYIHAFRRRKEKGCNRVYTDNESGRASFLMNPWAAWILRVVHTHWINLPIKWSRKDNCDCHS